MIPLPEKLLLQQVAAVLDVGDPGELKALQVFTPSQVMNARSNRTKDHRLTLGEILADGEMIEDRCYMLFEFAEDGSPTQGEGQVIAYLDNTWWSLGPWQTEGCREVRRCGLGTQGTNCTIEPRFKINDRCYLASTKDANLSMECPDCKGSGKWSVTSPGGYIGPVDCPRCHFGTSGEISQHAWKARAEVVTIGRVSTTTAPHDFGRQVEYCESSRGGRIWFEWQLFDNAEDALALAEILAKAHNDHFDKHHPKRVREREQMYFPIVDAKLAEAEHSARESSSDLLYLRRRVMELLGEDSSLYISGKVTEDEDYDSGAIFEGTGHVSRGQRERVVAWVMSFWDGDAEFYLNWKEEKRQEEDSC